MSEPKGEAVYSVPHSKLHCPECSEKRFIKDYENAEIVCINCGFVVQEKIEDTGPEWRAFDGEQRAKRTRVGAPSTFTIHDKGLSTMIDWRNLRCVHSSIYQKTF
jgi:transcription initiation factor TFIIB